MTKKLSMIVRPVVHELRREGCGFQHNAPDNFVRSQWQNRTKSFVYLLYRWCIALFFTAVVIISMWPEPEDTTSYWLYFIYMTNWGIWLCMLTNLLAAYLVTIWHYEPQHAAKILNDNALSSPFRIYWGLHLVTLSVSIVITIIYWSVLYNPIEYKLDVTNVLTHALNSICMFIDLWIVAHPVRLLHMLLPVAFGLIYAVFSFIFQICGGINKKGKPYIYYVIDWREPLNAICTIIAILLLLCVICIILFVLYKIRLMLYKRWKRATTKFEATTTATATATPAADLNATVQQQSADNTVNSTTLSAYENHGFAIVNEIKPTH